MSRSDACPQNRSHIIRHRHFRGRRRVRFTNTKERLETATKAGTF